MRHMHAPYDTQALRKAANLSINADLLRQARDMNINLSATLERALIEALRKRQREQWLAENRAAIEAYNDHVERSGVFCDRLKTF